MKGIIWRKSSESEAAEILFEQIIMNYEFIKINGEVIKTKDFMRFIAENGDIWEVLPGYERFRGKKCNISYIERGIHDPSVQMAYRIANYFKVALPVLFPDMNEKNKE